MKRALGVVTMLCLTFLGVAPWAVAGDGAFSGGGGPLVVGALLDLRELERSLQGIVEIQGDFDLGDQSLFLLRGGGGFGGPELRFGGLGLEGEWSFAVMGNSEFSRLTLKLGGGGFLMDRLIADTDQGGVSLGAVIGGGEWTVRLSKNAQGSFSEIVRQPVSLEMHRSFWFASPYVSAEFRIFDFVGLRASAGYWVTLSFEDWKVQDGPVAVGGPLRNVGFPFLQLMLVFGG